MSALAERQEAMVSTAQLERAEDDRARDHDHVLAGDRVIRLTRRMLTARTAAKLQETARRGEVSISRRPVRPLGDHPTKEDPVKYMLLIHQGDAPTPRDPEAWAQLPEDEQKAVFADYQAINQTAGVTPGVGLQDAETATTVRVQDGKTLTTDGPFVELKEAMAGYLIYEADDLDAAIELAARIPAARLGGAIEIRPVQEW